MATASGSLHTLGGDSYSVAQMWSDQESAN